MSVGWIVVQTSPNAERKAVENIERQKLIEECYLPVIREERLGRYGAIRERLVPLFPKYLFVLTTGPWRFLLGTLGVVGVVRSSDSPSFVPDGTIAAIKDQEDAGGVVQLPEKLAFEIGQSVRVEHGVMAGQIGIYRGASSLEREIVLFRMLGQDVVTQVATGNLSAI